MRRLRDALGKGDWFSELFALSGLAWAVAEIIVVKINLSPFFLSELSASRGSVWVRSAVVYSGNERYKH